LCDCALASVQLIKVNDRLTASTHAISGNPPLHPDVHRIDQPIRVGNDSYFGEGKGKLYVQSTYKGEGFFETAKLSKRASFGFATIQTATGIIDRIRSGIDCPRSTSIHKAVVPTATIDTEYEIMLVVLSNSIIGIDCEIQLTVTNCRVLAHIGGHLRNLSVSI